MIKVWVLFLRGVHYAFRTDTCQLALNGVLTNGKLFHPQKKEPILCLIFKLGIGTTLTHFLPASHVTHPGIPLNKSAELILSNDWERTFYAQEY